MTQTELFPPNELGSAPVPPPRNVAEAIAAGYRQPASDNPFLWSSTLWEAFTLGQHLRQHGYAKEGFRKARGSVYSNGENLAFRFFYDRSGWALARG